VNATTPPIEDLIYDVGLHKGEDSAFYLALGYRVVAFEANPELVAACRTRFAAEIGSGRLTIIEGAISDSDAPVVTFFTHPNSVWGTTQKTWVARNDVLAASTAIEVPRIKFAEVLRGRGIPHYLKVDIEGADELCLRTLLEFHQRPMYVSIESEQKNWTALLAEFDLLERLGYDQFAVVQQGTIPGRTFASRTITGRPLRYRFESDASGPFADDVGPWVDRETALRRYRRVFVAYGLLGPEGLIRRTKFGRGLRGQAARLVGHPLPGWYDTHARRSDAFGGGVR
jgi:FkbM family methyltransferase